MTLLDAILIVASSIVGTLASGLVIMNFIKTSKEFNPFIKINEKLKQHDEELEKHNERIEANKIEAVKVNTALSVHQDVFAESQYIMLKAIKALIDHAINPNKNNIEKASQELEDYLLKK